VAPCSPSASPLDVEALSNWLDTHELPGRGEPLEVRLLSGGSQNEMFEIRRADLHCVLRKPPASAPSTRDAGILREWHILDALKGTGVPHAAALALCDDPAVLGRPFYVTDFVEGFNLYPPRDWPPPFDDPGARRGCARALVDGVVAMGNMRWQERGLSDLGRPAGFHDRQVPRWTAFHTQTNGRRLPGYAETTEWLARRRPLDFQPGLMHGDYQFANVMFAHDAPARLAAIVDWEMCTIGDPKLDLAWALQSWPEDTSAAPSEFDYVDLTGMPGMSELLEHYSRESGRQVDDFDYYLVLARWKLAIVLERGFQRAGDDPLLLEFEHRALDLMRRAADLAESSDYRQGP
jgi:aminoglycoside phosphotransferase (APT) family kinase protein